MDDAGPLARNLRIWMEYRGFGQKALALKAKLNETYVRDILKGKSRNPTQSRLSKLAEALDCSLDDLTGNVADSRQNDPGRAVWNAVYDRLGPGDREFIIRSARGLARDDPTAAPPMPPKERPPPSRPMPGGNVAKNFDADCEDDVKIVRLPGVPG
jgi:transcriptional regulator with XRE-family HTH domain